MEVTCGRNRWTNRKQSWVCLVGDSMKVRLYLLKMQEEGLCVKYGNLPHVCLLPLIEMPNDATPTSPNGVAAIPHLSTQEALVPDAFNSKEEGIYILYEDVKSCPYEDVHVLWSILVESHSSLPLKR
ncbi:hypothetical protein V8G54_014525 [Vigna mungo]|uniref:Uncharacterized protein n=1 Tax=Vigna mungo TaxID=3915 RepID=A0AAQ3NHT1_VIGMU